ncbi:WecB: UDP-N-acetylglucosamine 2-epimerase [Desulfosarcina variabilis str. Montpellier]|uniref:non-hydrolyzing UDP-N-acetylglucosamine 2-epimerase n=1 Tax=Desulfosarcina variabilis TaxID=2300 RepID=UPI003AFA448F
MTMKKDYKIHLIAAARPNFMKIAPLYHELNKTDWATPIIVHTGQHYDINMSDAFFKDLDLPEPHIHLGVGSGTHAEQTGRVMIEYEKVLVQQQPNLVVVVGDVNSTIAATLAAVKLGIKTAHLEAGLRSFDRTMPEEINRIVTDSIADLLWTPSPDGDENLIREGVPPEKIQRVGNIMIDSLEMMRGKIENAGTWQDMGLSRNVYAVVTLHRPANVDNEDTLRSLVNALIELAAIHPVVFPIHPRTRANLERFKMMEKLQATDGMKCLDPLNYVRFMNLVFNCRLVVTDSGGIQEETTYLGIPCITLRDNTERPVTVIEGTNRLCKVQELRQSIESILNQKGKKKNPPELWDGRTASRIAERIRSYLGEGGHKV